MAGELSDRIDSAIPWRSMSLKPPIAEVEQLALQIAPGAGDRVLLGVSERLPQREVLLEGYLAVHAARAPIS